MPLEGDHSKTGPWPDDESTNEFVRKSVEWLVKRHLEPPRPKCDRVLITCKTCGSWHDSPVGVGPIRCSDPEVYIGDFFSAFHVRSCKGGGGVSRSPYHSSAPPDRPPGAPSDPTTYPGFIPHSEAYIRHQSALDRRLLAPWWICNLLSSQFGLLHFLPKGKGIGGDWTKVDPALVFTWQINAGGNLVLQAEEQVITGGRLEQLFRPDGFRFEIVNYTEPYGEPVDYLLLWPHPGGDAINFHRGGGTYPMLIEDQWEVQESQDGLEVSRVNTAHLTKLLDHLHRMQSPVRCQMECVRKAKEPTPAVQLCFKLDTKLDLETFWKSMRPTARAEDERDNLWVMVDLVPNIFSHLGLPEDHRLACVFNKFGNYRRHCFEQTRLILIDTKKGPTLEIPHPVVRRAHLTGPAPEGLPSWITWNPRDLISDDGTPVSVFERFLLEHWGTLLFTPGSQLNLQGVFAGNNRCLFIDASLPMPEEFSNYGATPPQVAFVSTPNIPAAFLPFQEQGVKAIGGEKFAFLEFYFCKRGIRNQRLRMPGYNVISLFRTRVWYRSGACIWMETDRTVHGKDCFWVLDPALHA